MTSMYSSGTIVIGPTYHRAGFFNETDLMPSFPRPSDEKESSVGLECHGPATSISVQAKVRYRNADGSGSWINTNGKARIFGGKALVNWFQRNIAVGDTVRIEVIERHKRYRISVSTGNSRARFPDLAIDQRSSLDHAGTTSTPVRSENNEAGWHQRPTERKAGTVPESELAKPMTANDFETLARDVMSRRFGSELTKKRVAETPKIFDMVSEDGSVIGDAKYYTMVRGQSPPPAKFSVIAEHLWLLEKTRASRKFLVFGNDRRVPDEWLRRYGRLVKEIEFYFLDVRTHQVIRLA